MIRLEILVHTADPDVPPDVRPVYVNESTVAYVIPFDESTAEAGQRWYARIGWGTGGHLETRRYDTSAALWDALGPLAQNATRDPRRQYSVMCSWENNGTLCKLRADHSGEHLFTI